MDLRPIAAADLPALYRLTLPSVAGFNWAGYVSEAALRARFERDGGIGADDGQLVITETGEDVLGQVAWRTTHWSTPPWSRAWHIGLTVAPEHRRRGVASTSQRLLCDYLFGTTAVQRLEAVTDVDNIGEQRALRNAGFTAEGTLRQAEFRVGRWHDLLMFSRLRGEWTPPGS